ncbi:MAG: HU family DNA-binding protein, partial [Deltaproteobacteria bacterium]|nr:HU family DNA-binding protein [Deltaproteobacteria bacterium]
MNKYQLAEALAKRYPSPGKEYKNFVKSHRMVSIFFEVLTEGILAGERVELRGFGSFVVKDYKA